MDVLINRFNVKYNGKRFGPGEIIYDMPDNIAKKLVDESNGTITALPRRPGYVLDHVKHKEEAPKQEQKETNSDPDPENEENVMPDGSSILPPVDPKQSVKG